MSAVTAVSLIRKIPLQPVSNVTNLRARTLKSFQNKSKKSASFASRLSGKCSSCGEHTDTAYLSSPSKVNDRYCQTCITLVQSYGTGTGAGRLSKKTNSLMLADPNGITLVTSITAKNLGCSPNQNSLTVIPSLGFDTKRFFLNLMRNPPNDYVLIAFADSSFPLSEAHVNTDPNRMVISGNNGFGSNAIRKVDIPIVLRYYRLFSAAGFESKHFRAYVEQKTNGNTKKTSKVVAAVEALIPELEPEKPMSPFGCNANMTSFLLYKTDGTSNDT